MAQNLLANTGWHIDVDAIPDLNAKASTKDIIKKALDLDLRHIAIKRSLGDLKSKSCISGPLVVQLQKIINIAVPKDQSEISLKGNSRRLLLMTVSDGNVNYQALELQPIKGLSMDTPPGTKLLIKDGTPVLKGFIQIQPGNVEVLGGHVPKLASAWELNRQLGSRAAAMLKSQNQRQQAGPGGQGPPAFVPFGQRIPNKFDATYANNFKAMDVISKDKAMVGGNDDGDDTDEFVEQRQAAIAKLVNEQKKKQEELAIPDLSQLSITTKPNNPPPKPVVPVVVSSNGPDGDDRPKGRASTGGRFRRGRGNYEDDYESSASMGRPSKFSLFDVIQQQSGQEKLKLVAETAKLVSEPEKSSARGRYDDHGSNSSGSRGSHRGGRGGRGNWRGRGGSAGGSRSSFSKQPPLFREGSAASSRVDSVSPISEGGRNGAGRDLPPRLKRHQQNSFSQSWAEEDGSDSVGPPLSSSLFISKSRSSTSAKMGDVNSVDGDDETVGSLRLSQSERSTAAVLPSASSQQALAALYTPVIPTEATAAAAYSAVPDSIMAIPTPGFAISPQIYAGPSFVSNSLSTSVGPSLTSSTNSHFVATNQTASSDWHPGAYCYARWSDGSLYPAIVVSIDSQAQTAVINYYQYNDIQTVPFTSLLPMPVESAIPVSVPQPVVLTMLPPPQGIPPTHVVATSANQQQPHPPNHSQQRNFMWFNGSPLLPAPPPFPGMGHFNNRLGLQTTVTTVNSTGAPATGKETTKDAVVDSAETNKKPTIEQQSSPTDSLPVETVVAAG